MNWWNRFWTFVEECLQGDYVPPADPVVQPEPPLPITPEPMEPPVIANIDTLDPDWSLQKSAYHNVRVLCDLAGLTVIEKNVICACIYQESQFKIHALNNNKNARGAILSTDYGICQINDYYHIGPNKDFPSVDYVLNNPQACVQYMLTCYSKGLLKMWVSYSSGAYKKWLGSESPMWLLAE